MRTELRQPLSIAGAGLLMGMVADYLFYGGSMGISVPIFTIVALIIGGIVLLREQRSLVISNLWLILPMLFFAIMASIRAAPLLVFLNISGVLLLMLLLAHTLTARSFSLLTLGDYMIGGIQALFMFLLPTQLVVESAKAAQDTDAETRSIAKRIGVGALLAAPFLCVFSLLFASADLVFSQFSQQIIEAIHLDAIVSHIFWVTLFGWLSGGLLLFMLNGDGLREQLRSVISKSEEDDASPRFAVRIGLLETSIVLFSIDLLFALFVAVQFATLFGGEAFLQRQGLTYSEYARRGFFEMVTVATIVFTLLIVLDAISPRETRKQQALFVTGAAAMLGMTVIMLVSAVQRMSLYEEIFGFTRLRLHTHVFMAWMAVLLLGFIILLISKKVRYFPALIVMFCIGFTATLNILNPDRFIAVQNIRRWEAGEELDAYHLANLSEDAIQVVLPFYLERREANDTDITDAMTYPLWNMQRRLSSRADGYRWPERHIARDRAHGMLADVTFDDVGRSSR